MPIFNFGARAERFAMRPPEKDWPINILEGAVRSGKTWCLHPKVLYCCHYNVAGRKVLTGVSKQSVYNNVLSDLFAIVGPSNYNYNRNTGQLRLCDSEWLVIGAKDEGSEKYIRGLTVGVALCDELSLMPQSFFQMLLSRMSPAGARLYATTNPDSPYHWLKPDYLDNPELRAKRIVWSQHFTMADNPNLPPEFIESQKRLYSGFFYKRFIEGMWVVAEGAIYKDFWSEDLVYDLHDEPPGLRHPGGHAQRIIPVDYGTTNPMVFLDIYDDGQRFWVAREYYWDSTVEMRQKTDAEYADDLAQFIGPQNDAKVIVDPSAASFKAEMIKRGIWHVDADNDVNDGIRIVSMVLNQRLARFCRQTAPKTIQELQTYAWDPKAAQRGEEKPLKGHDHGPDAFRYFAKSEVPWWRLSA
ncbi:MAG: PBSX family phage terminase large subunit [Acidobacteriales bacterium]|nr:PBSX family phage terminase large subunit [Terriglobales bacterium]